MIEKSDLSRIKTNLEGSIGQRVKLTARKGRKKATIRLGVIESIHPSIFTVKLDTVSPFCESVPTRRVSYSYTDILTNSVELVLCVDNQVNDVVCS